MYCPMCSNPLRAVERQGVPIDYCSYCEGVWLDRGELDELIRREAMEALLQGQRTLAGRRNSRAYDRVDHEAPSAATPRRYSLQSTQETRR
jgi:uncharacterized protein